jgi:hypothetical protein
VSTAGNRASDGTVSLCREGQAGQYQMVQILNPFRMFGASSTPNTSASISFLM